MLDNVEKANIQIKNKLKILFIVVHSLLFVLLLFFLSLIISLSNKEEQCNKHQYSTNYIINYCPYSTSIWNNKFTLFILLLLFFVNPFQISLLFLLVPSSTYILLVLVLLLMYICQRLME